MLASHCKRAKLTGLAALSLLGACSSGGGVIERLDSTSGLTFVSGDEVVAFARTDARLSRSARDYVYLGPVEVNERGTREYFLWVGIASTIDRNYVTEELQMPNVLLLDLAGAPVEFELQPWDEALPRLRGQRVYEPPVRVRSVLIARVTLDQLALMSREPVARVRTVVENAAPVEYFVWNSILEWPEFLRNAGVAEVR